MSPMSLFFTVSRGLERGAKLETLSVSKLAHIPRIWSSCCRSRFLLRMAQKWRIAIEAPVAIGATLFGEELRQNEETSRSQGAMHSLMSSAGSSGVRVLSNIWNLTTRYKRRRWETPNSKCYYAFWHEQTSPWLCPLSLQIGTEGSLST